MDHTDSKPEARTMNKKERERERKRERERERERNLCVPPREQGIGAGRPDVGQNVEMGHAVTLILPSVSTYVLLGASKHNSMPS